jgi:hypothetical protein
MIRIFGVILGLKLESLRTDARRGQVSSDGAESIEVSFGRNVWRVILF